MKRKVSSFRKAAKITDQIYSLLLKGLNPGILELDLAKQLRRLCRSYKLKNSFPPIIASGSRSAYPHGKPTKKKIRSGELIVIDFGVVYNNHCSDLTRTVILGKPTKKQKQIYALVRQAQAKALAKVKAGVKCKDVDFAARSVIARAKLGKCFKHGTGHGVGTKVHEKPKLGKKSRGVLQAGMVITIEPGVYIRGWGGVRIEDMVLVTKRGYQALTKASKEFER